MEGFNLQESVDAFLFFVSQSAGITLPRIIVCLCGLVLGILTAVRFWEQRLKAVKALIGVLLGIFMVAVSLNTSILHQVIGSSFLSRIRLLLGLLSLFVFAITFESIRIARLKERFAFLWLATSGMVLLAALFPQLIQFVTEVLGVQYITAIVAVVFTFLLMVAFHFSIALSGLEEDRAKIAQRCALLDLRLQKIEARFEPEASEESPEDEILTVSAPEPAAKTQSRRYRKIRGGKAASWLVIGLAWFVVLWVGLSTPQPMIGDEVTHFYMLEKQVEEFPTPNFYAEIPNAAYDQPEVRRYPHPNGWHTLGAAAVKVFPNTIGWVQVYQSLFYLQLLWVGYAWAKSRRGEDAYSAFLYVIVLASLPMNLLFGVAFYQDVPLAAQVLTAFYLLDRRKFALAGLFMALAMWIKVTGVIFLIPFGLVCAVKILESSGSDLSWKGKVLRMIRCGSLPLLFCVIALGWNSVSLKKYAEGEYMPIAKVEKLFDRKAPEKSVKSPEQAPAKPAEKNKKDRYEIVANHPGDLRNPRNFLIYGGGLMWLILCGGIIGLIRPRSSKVMEGGSRKNAWPLLVGGFYILVVAVALRSAPDARFFLPALPLLLLPLCEWTMRLPKIKVILLLATLLAILQTGYVLKKTHSLRSLPDGLKAGIHFLETQAPSPERILMYPEGNYRYFPVEHEWDMDYGLQAFWGMPMEDRIKMLEAHQVGGVVVKKHLIAPVNDPKKDLGVYPPAFVEELKNSPAFEKVFNNEYMTIFYLIK